MKKSCDGCRALESSPCSKYEMQCVLGYLMDSFKWKPLEQCPKPRTNIQYCKLPKKNNYICR